MTRITLEPRFFEIGPFKGQYDELVEAMKADGYDVYVKREMEQRGTDGILETAWDLAVHIGDIADDHLIELMIVYLYAHLKGAAILGRNRGKRRRAFIYGQNGEKLREVELPDEE